MGVVGGFSYKKKLQTGKGSHMFNRSCDLRDVLMTSELYI